MKFYTLLFYLTVSLCFLSCGGAKKITKPSFKKLEKEELLKWMAAQQLNPQWFSAKGKILYRSDYDQIRFTVNIRARKDSVVWMNIKKLGIEVARLLVRPDSVFLLDRLGNGYVADDLSFFAKEYNVPIDFYQMENLLLGNPHVLTDSMVYTNDSMFYRLSYENNRERLNLWLNNKNFTLIKEFVLDKDYDNSLMMQLSGYTSVIDSKNFSTHRKLDIKGPDVDDFYLDIQFSNLEFDVPKSIKFQIPDHYERIIP